MLNLIYFGALLSSSEGTVNPEANSNIISTLQNHLRMNSKKIFNNLLEEFDQKERRMKVDYMAAASDLIKDSRLSFSSRSLSTAVLTDIYITSDISSESCYNDPWYIQFW